LNSVG